MDKQKLENFLSLAVESRVKHSTNDRLIALEVMTCAIGASLEGKNRETFLKTMNSFSETLNPMGNQTVKAIADLNVLSANFLTLANQLADEE